MADVPLGSAYIDVGLKFDKMQADMKSVGSKLAPLQTAAAKGAKEASKLEAERIKKMHELLGVTEKIADAESDRVAKMSFLDRTMASMGAKINKGGMMGAQLSYAAQDFVTGLAMGNVNMAIMGASNNLGMMAMQISSAAAAWTTLGLVAIPLAITAFKAFGGQADNAKDAIDRLNQALERQRFGFKLNAIAREALTDKEIRAMHGAANLEGRVRGEEKALGDVNEVLEEQGKLRERVEPIAGGIAGKVGELPAGHPLLKDIEKFHLGRKGLTPTERDRILRQLGLTRGFFDEGGRKEYEMRELPGGGVQVFRKATKEQIEDARKQLQDISSTTKEAEEQRDKHKANLKKLYKRRDEEVREELEFRQREQRAGFNKYEQGKIRLDREEREQRRRNEEMGFGEVVVKPAMSEADLEKRVAENEEKAEKQRQELAKQNQQDVEKMRIHGRVPTAKSAEAFRQKQAAIEAELNKSNKQALEDYRKGPGTLLEESNRLTGEEFNRRRLELAQQFAAKPPGHFTGMEQLAKDVQQGIGGPKGLDIAAQTAANTKATADAQKDIIAAIRNLNLGVGP